jgi:hypothetical protein
MPQSDQLQHNYNGQHEKVPQEKDLCLVRHRVNELRERGPDLGGFTMSQTRDVWVRAQVTVIETPATTSWLGERVNVAHLGNRTIAAYDGHHGEGEHDKRDMPVPAMPGAGFVVIEAELVLGC